MLMIRKFKCKNCNHVYEADELNPNCVYCGSDNVTPYKPTSPAVKVLLVSVLGIGLGFGCAKVVSMVVNKSDMVSEPKNNDDMSSISLSPGGGANLPVKSSETEDSNIGNGEALMEISSGKPEITSVSDPVWANGSYKFDVKATTKDGDDLVFNLYATGVVDPVAYSSNGGFRNIPPAEDGTGIYTLEVKNSRTGEYTSCPVSGFVQQVEKKVMAKKLSVEDLQKMFNSGSIPSNVKSSFAFGYKIVCSGLAEDETAPDRYEEIFNRLIASWSSVVVTGVKYNDRDQITSINIKVNY